VTRSFTLEPGSFQGKPALTLRMVSFMRLIFASTLSRWSPAPLTSISTPGNWPTRADSAGCGSMWMRIGLNPLDRSRFNCAWIAMTEVLGLLFVDVGRDYKLQRLASDTR
jgi:hypothetical protein